MRSAVKGGLMTPQVVQCGCEVCDTERLPLIAYSAAFAVGLLGWAVQFKGGRA